MYHDAVQIYTDGSALNNPGPGGWAFCYNWADSLLSPDVRFTGKHKECRVKRNHDVVVSGGEAQTTNNRMELQAVIESLKWIQDVPVVINSDSQLTIKCAEGIWKRKANTDLWTEYDNLSAGRVISFVWVKAHSGDTYNEIVDKAARDEAYRKKKESSRKI